MAIKHSEESNQQVADVRQLYKPQQGMPPRFIPTPCRTLTSFFF
jgi:hypothetical protein